MAGNLNQPGESVSTRLLRVLEAFDLSRTELSLTEIATAAELPISTARRLIGELTAWGGLERLVNGRYRIGLRMWKIGVLAPQQRGLHEAAAPLMHDLCKATRETVQLVVLDGRQGLCVEKVTCDTAAANLTEVGGRLPLHATGVGKCMLAYSSADLLEAVLRGGLRRHTPYTIVQPGQLVSALREARKAGVAFSREEMTIGAASVAAPIVAPGGVLLGALGVVVRPTTKLEHLAPAVKTAALSIARMAGAPHLARH